MKDLEIKRQLLHASGIFIALIIREAYSLSGGWIFPAFLLVFALAFGYTISYIYRRGINIPVFTRIINTTERDRDMNFPVRGALRFFKGSLITLFLFRHNPTIVVSSIMALALADSASTVGGVLFGKHAIGYNKEKTIEGSAAGFLFATLGFFILTNLPPTIVVLASLTAVVVESLPLEVDDNLTIPVAVGLVLWLIPKGIII